MVRVEDPLERFQTSQPLLLCSQLGMRMVQNGSGACKRTACACSSLPSPAFIGGEILTSVLQDEKVYSHKNEFLLTSQFLYHPPQHLCTHGRLDCKERRGREGCLHCSEMGKDVDFLRGPRG